MNTVFIVNPKAGQGKNIQKLIDSIKSVSELLDVNTEIYITKSVGDGKRFVCEYCENNGAARFIACGGDGTLSEVLNGAIGFDDAEIGVIPTGTGNDFCRNFKDIADFRDIKLQITGRSVKCDAVKFTTEIDGETRTGYGVNMFNIGFDCNVADMTGEIKKKPLISGSFAYFVSILINLVIKKCTDLKIELDGKTVHNGPLLLTSVANGCFCGGGIKSNPLAEVNDGLININIVNNVSRCRFITLLPHYMKGDFLKLRGIEKVLTSQKCTTITITPLDGRMRICNDGEINDAGRTEFEIVPQAFKFVVPH